MSAERIEDDQATMECAQTLIKMFATRTSAFGNVSSKQAFNAMFSAMTALAAINGWTLQAYRDWLISSAEISWQGFEAAMVGQQGEN